MIAERPTKAAAARAALADITLNHLAEVEDPRGIAQLADDLRWAEGAGDRLYAPIRAAIPVFQTLAMRASQHLAATLPYNRREALEKLRDIARDLALTYSTMPGRVPGAVVAAARRWRQVAEAKLDEMGREDEASGRVYNPFVFGQPIEETETNQFVGRQDIVREIEVNLLGGQQKPTLVLWGPRRMGKTSVLMQLPRLLGPDFAVAFVDMQAGRVRESVPAFFHGIAESAATALARRGVAAPTLELSELKENPFNVFASWLKTIEGALAEVRYLLLCLDEYERLEQSIIEGRLSPDLMDEMRHIIQHHPAIPLLFSGSHRPDEMSLNWPDTLISSRLIRVSYLSEEEARQLITEPVPDFGIAYAEESIERIIEVTRCQPNLVQAVCYELVNHLNVEGRRDAQRPDIDLAVEKAFESAHLYFAEMWKQLSVPQEGLLQALARTPEQAHAEALAVAAAISLDQASPELRTLRERSIIETLDGAWRFQVPMVGEWVRRRAQ